MRTKHLIIISALILFFTFKAWAGTYTVDQNYTISITSNYTNNMSETWNVVSTETDKPILITYKIGTENNFDWLTINNVDNNGNVTSQLLRISGTKSGTISTISPNGRVQVKFTSDYSVCYANNPSFYWGINISFSANTKIENSLQVTGSALINGNAFIDGDVGIGSSFYPTAKLDVQGVIRSRDDIYGSKVLTFQDNARFSVTSTQVPELTTSPFSMPQYGVAAPNAGGSADLWLSGNNGIRMFTAGTSLPRLNILKNGNVGIGDLNPLQELSVKGAFSIYPDGTSPDNSYCGSISITQPESTGQYINLVRKAMRPWSIGMVYNTSNFAIGLGRTTDSQFTDPYFTINENGLIGIGTTSPDEKLTVNGTIHAKEVLIDLNGPLADYVFEPEFDLMSLDEVESYIESNKHLPNLPSAQEVKEKGLSMGEMQNKLLQKIEELTLYVIKQQKIISQQNQRLERLEKNSTEK